MDKYIVKVDNLSFSYDSNKVLENVSFSIQEGDFVGIIGPNGSAKSTLLKLMVGLLKPDEGSIKLLGKPIEKFNDYKSIGYISQNVRDFNQMFPATVEEVVAANLYLNRGLFNKLKKEDNMKIDKALQIVEMEEFKKRKIGNLSGGQKQRVFIARALVNNPKILFMDEPLVGMDLDSQNKFYNLMDILNKDYNITLVMISHDIGVISKKVNRILCLSKGKVYGHNSNQSICIDMFKDVYGENMNILFHNH
ncbi:metal ABC transporter ATP-binding protein [Clostridium sp. Cult2]|uniref:metal ABC transporter ATP-binding protein n=1 Tax=Clostridium sp. Cult2 TaxID=2079003 RepID=UPI001F36B171|nr:ABC transporter ATP-binding protein [Clostridium sp. Cult2]MCF6465719.1 zinc ABC transporter ATP-binding protein [Clostridium sp. Cult2]